jgi:hypothetical protein
MYYLWELKYPSIELDELERRNLCKANLQTCIHSLHTVCEWEGG